MLGTRKVVIYDGDKYYEESWFSIVRWDVQPALAAVLPTIFVERLSFAVRAPADFVSSWLGHLANAHRHPRCTLSLRQIAWLHCDCQRAHV
jgi:hypothetical protein